MLNSPLVRWGIRHSGTGSLVALLFCATGAAWSQSSDALSFQKDIYPILQQRCFVCHGEMQHLSELDLRTRETMLKGGAKGPDLVPGDARESRIYRRIAGLEAPVMPMGGEMPQDEILKVRDWINQGAPAEQAAAPKKDRPEDWWAFQRPVRPDVPAVADARWSKNPIDAFTYRKLQEKGLQPAPRADKVTLVRRAYLDLLGLLPSPAEVDAFLNDPAPDAYARLIDRLLESPHYGERWGRHWLDVARYADSGGYEKDYDYPYAWRYRDYVIQAFNKDKPYDQFVREQLAGDEVDKVTYETLTATGFNRAGPSVGFREKDNPQYRYNYLDDMIGTTSRAFMALTVNCARCHDHKFDPIKQVEYYRMMAVFFPYVNYNWPLAPPDQVAAYDKKLAGIDAQVQPLRERIAEIQEPYRKLAFEQKLKEFPEEIQVAVHTPEEQRTAGQKLLAVQVEKVGGDPGPLLSKEDRAEIAKLKTQIEEIEKQKPEELPFAMGIRDGDYRFAVDGAGDEVQPGKGERIFYNFEGSFVPVAGKPYNPPEAHLLPSADYHLQGDVVEPGFLGVLSHGNPPTALPPGDGRVSSGRRRALAEWLVSPDHPLTARVMVNRIWQNHFGRGIVATPSNFGHLGQLPTHPELLDWLATEFVRQGWSIKTMHRLMMNSETYQMSSAFFDEADAKKDPRDDYLWRYRQRRLEAEVIRDAILDAAGNLNLQIGGPPFFPPIPKEVLESNPNGTWEASEEGPAVWRRSVYSYFKRGLRYPMFDVFDLPDLNVTCEGRVTTTVPTQALTLLNNPFVLEQAGYFAKRVAAQAGNEQDARVRAAYRIALGREPKESEIEENVAFLNRQHDYHESRHAGEDASLLALVDLCHVILNLNEFVYLQ
jgi:Protein of unknown function (DUF1553)/Protein of unknown function (DUF1549)/Planctomycete cytochrome C